MRRTRGIPGFRRAEENETKKVVVWPDLVVVIYIILDYISAIRSREDSKTKPLAFMPDLIVVIDARSGTYLTLW